jgi:hypothetical protein
VFNLAVDGDHEYFAAGILVHNCDSLSGAFNKLARREVNMVFSDD